MSKENPYYLVHVFSQNRFGEKFNIGSVAAKYKEKNGKTYVLFNSRYHLVYGILKKISVNDYGKKLEFNVSFINYLERYENEN